MARLKTILAGAAASILAFSAANAATVTVQDNPDNGASVFATDLGRSVYVTYHGDNLRVGAGAFSLQYDEGSGYTDFLTFCLQFFERLTLPKLHERVEGADYFTDAADREALGILYGGLMNEAYGLKNANTAAAMQAIIWEITEDGATNFDLRSGAFILLTSDVLAEADKLWALVTSGQFVAIDFDVCSARGTQDLIVSQVPVQGALLLFGTALAGFGSAKRRRRA